MAKYNLITNLNNQAGLERDWKLLKVMLETLGHEARGVDFTHHIGPQADVNIFIEVINPELIGLAKQNWLIPNSEWYFPVWDRDLPRFNRILPKTMDGYRLWCKKVGGHKVTYIGFEANDFYRPEIKREKKFIHLAGKSETKNSAAVAAAWREYKLPYPLTIVAFKTDIVKHCVDIPNVTHINRYSDEETIQALNRNLFHVMPSKYEGFGQLLHEAVGCGAVVLTTDAPPMNEFNGVAKELLIPVARREPMRMAQAAIVGPSQVAESVRKAVQLSDERIAQIHREGREAFLSDREFFRKTFAEVVNAN